MIEQTAKLQVRRCPQLVQSSTRSARALYFAFHFLVVSTAGRAQEPRDHKGFWISFGPGVGLNLYDVHERDDRFGKAFYVRLGGTPSQKVLVGFEAIYWGRGDLDRGNTTLTVAYYPSRAGGFFGRGGVGTSIIDIGADSRMGVGATAGIGFDTRLTRNFYITPNVDWLLSLFYDSEPDPSLGMVRSANSQLLLTVGVTWH
jgi:hypothetical protein